MDDIRERLEKLPRRAIAAIAVRCAQRLNPIGLRKMYFTPPEGPPVRRAIDNVNEFVMNEERVDVRVLNEILGDFRHRGGHDPGMEDVARSVVRTAIAAVSGVTKKSVVADAMDVVDVAANVIAGVAKDPQAREDMINVVREDLSAVEHLGLGDSSKIGPTINLEMSGPLGPLWPAGLPDWYRILLREAGSRNRTIFFGSEMQYQHKKISVFLDAGDAPAELITDFFLALSAVYESVGGSPLEIVKDENRSLAAKEVES